jgi:hypothetical protein
MQTNSVSKTVSVTRRNFFAVTGAGVLGLLGARKASACSIEATCIGRTDNSVTIRVVFGETCGDTVPRQIQVTGVSGTGATLGPITFTGNADGTTDITIDGLECDASYTFEIVGIAIVGDDELRSDTIRVTSCSPECADGCTRTQGYWRNHPGEWLGVSLSLGNNEYTQAELLAIFRTPVRGNGLILLAHQLIAAKLNVLAGASSPDALTAIAAADDLIGNLVVGVDSLHPATASGLAETLDQFNNGNLGPLHCAG